MMKESPTPIGEMMESSSSSPYPLLELEERSAISSSVISEGLDSTTISSPPRGNTLISPASPSNINGNNAAVINSNAHNDQPFDEVVTNVVENNTGNDVEGQQQTKQASAAPGNTTPSSSSATTAPTPTSPLEYSLFTDQEQNDIVNSSERMASYAIYGSLAVFAFLVGISILLAVRVIQQQYGLIAIFFIMMIVTFWFGLIQLVKHLLTKEERLKPVRNKLEEYAEQIQIAIQEEYDAFREEYSDYMLLLTNGDGETFTDEDMIAPPSASIPTSPLSQSPTPVVHKKKKKSVVFKMIKPFLKIRKGAKKVFGKKKDSNNKNQQQQQTSAPVYQPPPTATQASFDGGVSV